MKKFILVVVMFNCIHKYSNASDLNIAVSSNFAATAKQIALLYKQSTGNNVLISTASTSVLYNQIKNGAPFDIFLSADESTPTRLIQQRLAVESSNFTYAIGHIVLWSNESNLVDRNGEILKKSNLFSHIAIANPKLAPYGVSAYQVLAYYKLDNYLNDKIVLGDNVNSTYQLIASGNAELGFVSLSQIMRNGKLISGSYWIVPTNIALPIKQNGVILSRSTNNKVAYDFMRFLKTQSSQKIIHNNGYQ